MKNWNKIFIIISLVVIISSLFYIIFLLGAKSLLINKIEQATGRNAGIDKLNINPPFSIEIVDLNIEGLVRVGHIYLSPSILNLLIGRLAFNKVSIINPEVTYQRPVLTVAPQTKEAIVVEAPVSVESLPQVPAPKSKSLPIMIKSLKVYSGRLNFIDATAPSGVINVIVKDIEIFITNLTNFGSNSVSNFSLKGNISWSTGEPDGKILLQGWVNLHKKDILATLKIENIDAIVFYPYYSTWVDLEKARIDQAKLNFTSEIKGTNNDVLAACHLELADIVRKVRLPDEQQQKAERLTDAVLDMFKTMNQGKVVLDFTLHTKMDRPEFGFGNIKSALEGKIMQGRARAGLRPQDMLLLPGKWLQGGFKSGKDISNAAIDGVFALGSGIKKFFEDGINRPVSEN